MKKYPMFAAVFLSVSVIGWTLFTFAILFYGIKRGDVGSAIIAGWNVLTAGVYIAYVIYAYIKREQLLESKINFYIYSGFLLYLFINFAGCFAFSQVSIR